MLLMNATSVVEHTVAITVGPPYMHRYDGMLCQ
jgi:hypothetical protein